MASQLEQAIQAIIANDYLSLVVLTTVGYDYILTFSREVEYIWTKPWVWVSTLFVIARYSGLCYIISAAITGSSFLPGPLKADLHIRATVNRCVMFFHLGNWSYWIFMCTADLVMILRVYALYNQSRLVLGALLALISLGPGSTEVGIAQVLQFSFCAQSATPPASWLIDFSYASTLTLGVLMCLLTAIRFTKELLEVYSMTNSLYLNRYMKCLAQDGTVYFIVVLLFALFTLLNNAGIQTADGWLVLVSGGLEQTPPVTLIPRFILGLRELYAQEVRGDNIDTTFFGSGFGHCTVRSTIRFADTRQDENEGLGDEIQMEEWIQDIHRVQESHA